MNRMPAAVEMNVAEGPEAEGARRATGAPGPSAPLRASTPDPEVPAKVQRRQFTATYRLRILREADACTKHGALGALLRREGLYSSHLVNWRRQRDQGELVAGRARRRGPTPKPIDPRVRQLEVENRRLQRKLARAETIITLQKNYPARLPRYLLDQKLQVRLPSHAPGGVAANFLVTPRTRKKTWSGGGLRT